MRTKFSLCSRKSKINKELIIQVNKMNIQDLIRRIRSSLGAKDQLSDELVLGFLRVLEDEGEDHLSCDEIFIKLDQYVDCETGTKDAAHLMPLIRHHLDTCPECCEEYEVLLEVVKKCDEN